MSVLPAFSSPDEAASVASSEIDRLNAFACDGQHFGWYSETINAMVLKQSVAETFGHIQLGACIFANYHEACMHMREIICSVLVKSTSKCGSSNLNIIVWALRSLCKLGCHSSDLQLFSSYLSHHAAVHADAAAPLMLSYRRHHVVDALYYNLIAMHCLSALSMRRIDCSPSSLEVNHSLSTIVELAPETDPKRNISATNPGSRAPLHSIIQDTQVQRVLSNIQLRALTCIKLLGLSFVSPLEEKNFLLKLLQLNCVSVPFRLQDSTFIQQPPRLLLGRLASVVFKSSIHLAVPQPILQVRPLRSLFKTFVFTIHPALSYSCFFLYLRSKCLTVSGKISIVSAWTPEVFWMPSVPVPTELIVERFPRREVMHLRTLHL